VDAQDGTGRTLATALLVLLGLAATAAVVAASQPQARPGAGSGSPGHAPDPPAATQPAARGTAPHG